MNTSKEYEFYKTIILDSIYEDYNGHDISNASIEEKIEYMTMRINGEMGWRFERGDSYITVITDWFQGLALNTPYMNYEILELGKKAGLLRKNASEASEGHFLDSYWKNLAITARKLIKNKDIPSYL